MDGRFVKAGAKILGQHQADKAEVGCACHQNAGARNVAGVDEACVDSVLLARGVDSADDENVCPQAADEDVLEAVAVGVDDGYRWAEAAEGVDDAVLCQGCAVDEV